MYLATGVTVHATGVLPASFLFRDAGSLESYSVKNEIRATFLEISFIYWVLTNPVSFSLAEILIRLSVAWLFRFCPFILGQIANSFNWCFILWHFKFKTHQKINTLCQPYIPQPRGVCSLSPSCPWDRKTPGRPKTPSSISGGYPAPFSHNAPPGAVLLPPRRQRRLRLCAPRRRQELWRFFRLVRQGCPLRHWGAPGDAQGRGHTRRRRLGHHGAKGETRVLEFASINEVSV